MSESAQPHLDVDSAADLDAGALDEATATQWYAHVRTCPACTGTLDAVHGVRDALAGLAPAGPMPADLRERWTTSLAEEPATPVGLPRARRRALPRPSKPFLQLVAAAAACAAVFGAVRVLPQGSGGGSDSAASKAAAPAAAPASSAGAAESSAGASSGATTGSGGDSAPAAPAPALPSASPADRRSVGELPTDLPGLRALARSLASASNALKSTDSSSPTRSSSVPTAPTPCLTGLGGAAPTAVADGSYRGTPAQIVVQPVGGDRLRVSVVRLPCAAPPGRAPLRQTETDAP